MSVTPEPENRCRLILAVPSGGCGLEDVEAALAGGDVASVILLRGDLDEQAYQQRAASLVPAIQQSGAAALVVDESRVLGRAEADGIVITGGKDALDDAIARFSPKRIVGCAGRFDRHSAMETAEQGPDFLFLGSVDGDTRPEAHPKNLRIGEWAGEVMQVSLVIMGGSAVESVIDVAACGVDFVCLSKAVFAGEAAPGDAVRKANELLDEHAPRFEDDA